MAIKIIYELMANIGYGYVSQGLYTTKDSKYMQEAKVRLANQLECKVSNIDWTIKVRYLSYEQYKPDTSIS